jgi:hypothetical protein
MAFLNKSPFAFRDVEDLLQRALDSKSGIKITCRDHGEAMSLRTRIHYHRRKDKELNAQTYPPEHILHSSSVWDQLVCKVDDNILRIEPRKTDHLIIELIEPDGPNGSDPKES